MSMFFHQNKKFFAYVFEQTAIPGGLIGDTNMAAMMSREDTQYM